MSIIAAKTPDVPLLNVFDEPTNETLHAYAAFLGQSVMFVLTHVIQDVLAKDSDFVAWRSTHPGSFLPSRRRKRGRATSGVRSDPPFASAISPDSHRG